MITLLPVMQRACLCYYTIITYYYVIITPGSIITHYYLFQSPELADARVRVAGRPAEPGRWELEFWVGFQEAWEGTWQAHRGIAAAVAVWQTLQSHGCHLERIEALKAARKWKGFCFPCLRALRSRSPRRYYGFEPRVEREAPAGRFVQASRLRWKCGGPGLPPHKKCRVERLKWNSAILQLLVW